MTGPRAALATALLLCASHGFQHPRPALQRRQRSLASRAARAPLAVQRSSASSSDGGGGVDVNMLITKLNDAVAREDYKAASQLKIELEALRAQTAADSGEEATGAQADWLKLGAAPWLGDRLNNIGYRFSTPAQTSMMQALVKAVIESGEMDDGMVVDSARFEELCRDAVLRAPTGSGKTIAYLVSALTTVSTDLYNREKVIFDAVAATDTAASDPLNPDGDRDALARTMSYAFSPAVSMAELGSAIQLWNQQPPAANRKPLVMVLCPSRELCAQVGLQTYELFGGNIRQEYKPDDRGSLFNFRGPRGARIVGLLDTDDLERTDVLKCCDVVIATPELAADLYERDVEFFDDLKVVCIDESDLLLKQEKIRPSLEAMLLDRDSAKRRHLLVGATLGKDSMERATKAGLLESPVLVTASGFRDFAGDEDPLTKVDAVPMVPDGLVHRILPVERYQALANMVRLLRANIQEWEDAGGFKSGTPRPRAVIFAATNKDAREATTSLQNALWGQHKLYALLPEDGAMPLQVLEQFAGAVSASLESESRAKQASDSGKLGALLSKSGVGAGGASGADDSDFDIWGAATAPTVLLTTPSAARGLDFSNLTHVFSLNVPLDDAEYAHQAGRLGRLGNLGTGIITSVIEPSQEAELQGLIGRVAGAKANVEVLEVVEAEDLSGLDLGEAASKDKAVRRLDDIFELYATEEGGQ